MAVGEKVGISVGLVVTGDVEGSELVGSFDGDAVTGCKEGVAVGEKVGISVGPAVTGDLEGSELVGSFDGFDVGDAVTGCKEGVAVGEKVGISVGLAVTGDLEGSELIGACDTGCSEGATVGGWGGNSVNPNAVARSCLVTQPSLRVHEHWFIVRHDSESKAALQN